MRRGRKKIGRIELIIIRKVARRKKIELKEVRLKSKERENSTLGRIICQYCGLKGDYMYFYFANATRNIEERRKQ